MATCIESANPSALAGNRPRVYARLKHMGPALCFVTLVAVAHTLFATGSTWRFQPDVFTFYQPLGDAFLAGQLHLLITPDPKLLALADPYDPRQNRLASPLHDASLYNGRYYVYWGPAPAVIYAFWRLLTRESLDVRMVMIAAGICASLSFWLILDRLRRRHMPGAAGWAVWGSSLAFALGGIIPYLLGRPSIYHEALLVPVGFLIPSWLAFLRGHESDARRRPWLMVSGVLLGLAIATRITYLGYAVGPGLVLAWAMLRSSNSARRSALLNFAGFAGPVVLTGLLLGIYNWLRFDSPFEFGLAYQLQGHAIWYEHILEDDPLRDVKTLAATLGLYLLTMPGIDFLMGGYPFFDYGGYFHPAGVLVETPTISIFLLAPLAVLTTCVPLLVAGRSLVGPVRPITISMVLGLLSTLLLLGTIAAVSIRYTADVLPAFTLLGSLILLRWTAAYRHATVRSATLIGAVGAWTVSVIVGLMLGVGAWQYVYPVRAQQVAMSANESIAWLSTALPNEAVRSWTQPPGRTTWRHAHGYYLKDSTIYLRVPEPGASLIAEVASELPAGTELVVKVDHQPALRKSLQQGSQTVQTPALPGLPAGTVVPIHLELSGHAELAPGSRTALIVDGLGFTRNGRTTNPFSIDVALRWEVDALRRERDQLREEHKRAGAEFDRLKSNVEAARVAVGSEKTHPDRPRLAEQERLLKQQRRILDDAHRRFKDHDRLFRERHAELQRNEAEIPRSGR